MHTHIPGGLREIGTQSLMQMPDQQLAGGETRGKGAEKEEKAVTEKVVVTIFPCLPLAIRLKSESGLSSLQQQQPL